MPEHTQSRRLILIVTGSSLRGEELDRPLAYYLKQRVDEQIRELKGQGASLQSLVVSDLRWLHDEPLQELPTISVGGPGVNALAHRWLDELPLSLAVDEQFFLQMDPDLDDLKASIWGMDNPNTQVAVSAFVQRFLPRFLDRCASDAPELIEYEESDDD